MARARPENFAKASDAHIEYTARWATWLAGDVITESAWSVEPSGEMEITQSTNTTTTATVWLSGGTPGTIYEVTNRVTTIGNRSEVCTIQVYVEGE